MTPTLRTKYTFGALAGLSLLGTLAGCAAADAPASSDTGTDSGSSGSGSSETTESAEGYTDGDYSAEGSYSSPGGTETIEVELSLEGDIVTAVTVTGDASNPNAERYQAEFEDGIAAEVVGKDIDDLDVSRVAGSSLTSGGFNDALETIKADALG